MWAFKEHSLKYAFIFRCIGKPNISAYRYTGMLEVIVILTSLGYLNYLIHFLAQKIKNKERIEKKNLGVDT